MVAVKATVDASVSAGHVATGTAELTSSLPATQLKDTWALPQPVPTKSTVSLVPVAAVHVVSVTMPPRRVPAAIVRVTAPLPP